MMPNNPAAMSPYAPPGAMVGGPALAAGGAYGATGPAGARGKMRNPVMTLIICFGAVFAGVIVNIVFTFIAVAAHLGALAALGSIFPLAGSVIVILTIWQMLSELQRFTNDTSFAPWWMFVPLLNIYLYWIKVPEVVRNAKRMAGSRNPEPSNILLYIFLFPYAFAKDLNEVWDPSLA
jgi:hypothetical protein